MTQVENISRAIAHGGKLTTYRHGNLRHAGMGKKPWVEIALESNLGSQHAISIGKINPVIYTDAIRAGADERFPDAGALGKNYDRDGSLDGIDYPTHPLPGGGFKVGFGQQAAETVEYLNGVSPRFDLHL